MHDEDTPTDEQIRELLREAEGIERNDVYLARLCYHALRHPGSRVAWHEAARARIAEIINERKGGV